MDTKKTIEVTPEAAILDLTTKEGVLAYMRQSTTEDDWNNRCDEIKRVNGDYPSFWFMTMMMSGEAAKISANFKKSL